MERRHFARHILGMTLRDAAEGPSAGRITAGPEPYTTPLTLGDVYHLVRRVGFGARPGQARAMVGRTASDVVGELLTVGATADPAPPGPWVNAATENPLGADLRTRNDIEKQWDTNWRSLGNWWLAAMAKDDTAAEKLTAFWSSHFTTEFSFDNTNSVPQTLWRQYLLLRRMRAGAFPDLVLEVTVDNAMLFYLGGTYNEAGRPNENYARELLELFTTGIGWYTEGDVKEAARVLTGWKTARFNDEPAPNGIYNAWFDAAKHDTGAKQFMGQTIAGRTADNNTQFQVKNEEVLGLIRIVFEQRPEAVSRFLAEKMYRYFAYSSPVDGDQAMIAAMADAFRASGWNVEVMLKTLLTSAHFYDAALRGVQIKTPAECIAGIMRQFAVVVPNAEDWSARMDQAVLDPPTVAGWPGYRSWISTNTYPVRRQFAAAAIAGLSDEAVMAFIESFDDHRDVYRFVQGVEAFLLPVPVSQARHDVYVRTLLDTAPDYEWPSILTDTPAAARRTRTLLTTITKAPDFQLC